MVEESTHLVFDGNKVIISPDIMPVFNFLMEIEKEIDSILGFNKKLNGIKESHLEMIKFVGFLSNKLKENNIDFKYNFKENPDKIAEKLYFHFPLRSQAIVLFASLDVLFNLHMAYENETDNKDKLRELTMNTGNAKSFFNGFLLNEENQYYKINKIRLSKIDSTKLRDLRNSLTHFFSVGHGGLSLSPSPLDDSARKIENILKQRGRGNVIFISEEDLYELIKSANQLRMKKWSDDFQKDKVNFKKRMGFVINLVKTEGAITMIKNSNIK
ncbi:MAG: hypothetical protein NTW11_01455 [Candidatus Staskawiczbacteria bacterium]|nr:hypothetical protein [Candidatus Staskawiczbacteria bacterium]